MKIVHINSSDISGGASIAARRHVRVMRAHGIDARLLCITPAQPAPYTLAASPNPRVIKMNERISSRLNSFGLSRLNPIGIWSKSSWGLSLDEHPDVKDADAIFMHWVNGGLLSVRGIGRLLDMGKPVYWYMHDMWPITGGCHYAFDCEGYKHSCGKCPLFYGGKGSTDPHDLSASQMAEKIKRWTGHENLGILAPSRWLANCAAESTLFGGGKNSVGVIRNPVDTDIFHPVDKTWARKALGLPSDKRLILFGSAEPDRIYKGWKLLSDALELLDPTESQAIVFGNREGWTHTPANGMKLHPMGTMRDPWSLMLLYNAADIFVIPSLAENYPNVLIEAMACGTPCVGFNIGGIPEIINDGQTGIIASAISPWALAEAITDALGRTEQFAPAARLQIETTNSPEAIYQSYLTGLDLPLR